MDGLTMGDWTMEGLAFGAMLISMASIFVLSAWLWPENGVETSSESLEGIGSISTLESVPRMATRTTRYSFLLWTKKLAPLYLIWAYYYWQREGLTFCSVNNIATNVSFADFINGQRKFLVLERSFLAGAQGITSRLSRGTEFCHFLEPSYRPGSSTKSPA